MGHSKGRFMARAKKAGNDRLEEAIALLIQDPASFRARVSEMDRINAERFARIQEQFTRIEAILLSIAAFSPNMPACWQPFQKPSAKKIGFRPPAQSS